MTLAPSSPLNLLVLIAGFVIWALAFSLLYGVLSIGCEYGWQHMQLGPVTLNTAVLAAILVVHLAAHTALLVWTGRRARMSSDWAQPARFLAWACFGTAATGMIATSWTGAPIAFLTQCAM